MSVEELAGEYCVAVSKSSKMVLDAIDRMGYSGKQDEAAKKIHDLEMDRCVHQQDRIARILSRVSKIPADKLSNEFCKKGP